MVLVLSVLVVVRGAPLAGLLGINKVAGVILSQHGVIKQRALRGVHVPILNVLTVSLLLIRLLTIKLVD